MTTLPAAPASGSEPLTGTYVLDPAHTRLGFVARHAMVTKVRGRFTEFEGVIHLDGRDPSRSCADVTIDAGSIETRNPIRDQHLRSGDFLAAREHPQLTFRSTRIEPVDLTRFRVAGELMIKGTTRPVTFAVDFLGTSVDSDGNSRIGFEGGVTIDRRDWGVSWNVALEAGGVLVSEKVRIELDVSAIRTA